MSRPGGWGRQVARPPGIGPPASGGCSGSLTRCAGVWQKSREVRCHPLWLPPQAPGVFAWWVIMFVNVASKCGYTKQYKELQAIYKKYEKDGLVVIGVPANEFGKQEPGTNEEIEKFCTSKYSVTFPMMSKVVVKGEGIDPLYKFLTEQETKPAPKGDISWNFEKFLVGKDGQVVARFNPKTAP